MTPDGDFEFEALKFRHVETPSMGPVEPIDPVDGEWLGPMGMTRGGRHGGWPAAACQPGGSGGPGKPTGPAAATRGTGAGSIGPSPLRPGPVPRNKCEPPRSWHCLATTTLVLTRSRPAGDWVLRVRSCRRSQAGRMPTQAWQPRPGRMIGSLVRNRPLVDGNKRLAWTATVVFLRLNGVELAARETTWPTSS